ncbi:MAG: Gfo/Idh/MocA family protein [Ignavibacteriales bacterium]
MSLDAVRFALIGCGAIAERHGQALARIEDADLVAVVDVQEDRARRFAERFSGGHAVRVMTDYRQALDASDVDAVIVATPSGLHFDVGSDALDARKHVLMEKPLTLSSAHARTLLAQAEDNHVFLGTVHPNRYYPTSQMAHQAIGDGRLGRLSHLVATLRWNRTQQYYDEAPWRKTRAMDGGVLFNQAWHAIDLLLWFAGSVVSEVKAVSARRLHDIETEDIALATIRFDSGVLGSIEATTNVYPRNLEQTVSVFGGMGTVVLGGTRPDVVRVWRVAGDDESVVLSRWGEANAPKPDASWPHEQCIRSFLNSVREGHSGVSEEVRTAAETIDLIERVVGG